MIYLSLYNNNEIKIDTNNEYLLREIRDHFTLYESNYFWSYKYKSGQWNGKSSLFNSAKRTVPFGLIFELYKFLKSNNYLNNLQVDEEIKKIFKTKNTDLKINYDLKFYPYDYQKEIILDVLKKTRGCYVSSTGSGKSLIIAYIIKILYENNITKKHLIIVPTLSLIEQFKTDLIEYGIPKDLIGIANKNKKEFDSTILVSTWQTLKRNKDKITSFDMSVCDEVHFSKSKVINKIMATCSANMKYVLGVTGTMPSNKLEYLRVLSYIGPVWKEFKSTELANQGYLSSCNIKHIKIKYKNSFKGEYREVKQEVFETPYRLKIIKSIVENTKHTLILVEKVEDEGEFLNKYLKENSKKEIIFLSGKSKAEEREYWRNKMETDENLVIIATYGIFSTGINIKSLKNIVISTSSKSKIRILQSIGRSLRKHKGKDSGAFIWDLHDMVKNLKEHGNSRERFYINEGFEIETIEMNEKIDKNVNKLFT